jgi:hypothetical protein
LRVHYAVAGKNKEKSGHNGFEETYVHPPTDDGRRSSSEIQRVAMLTGAVVLTKPQCRGSTGSTLSVMISLIPIRKSSLSAKNSASEIHDDADGCTHEIRRSSFR